MKTGTWKYLPTGITNHLFYTNNFSLCRLTTQYHFDWKDDREGLAKRRKCVTCKKLDS